MYVIVAGAGTMGFRMASLLVQSGHSVTVIDQSEENLQRVSRQLDARTVLGSGVTPSVLREADVEHADMIIAATSADETNMITCFMAKELGVRKTVARVSNPDYTGYVIASAESPTAARRIVRPKTMGIDLIVNPSIIAGEEIVAILSTLYTTKVYEFAEGLVQIREFEVRNSEITNKPLRDIVFPKPCSVVAIVRPTEAIIPTPDSSLQLTNHVYLAAAKEALDEIGAMFSAPKRAAKNVVILGGGRTGFYIASTLEQKGSQVKIIELSAEVCQEIAPKLKHTVVVQGEGADQDFLIEEGVPSADALVAATSKDELNILVGLLAKNMGVSRSLAVVSKPAYISLAENMGIDAAISPALLAASKIVRFASHASMVSSALLAGEQVHAFEFVVSASAPITKGSLSKIPLPKGCMIGVVVHDHTLIIPQPDTTVLAGDRVIAISLPTAKHAIEELFD